MADYKSRGKRTAPVNRSKIEHTVDQLMAFERFRTEIAPELQEMLLKGATSKQILKKYDNYVAAKILTIALTEPDSSKALAACKDLMDRAGGKATETKKIEHSLQQTDDKELDALIKSEMADEAILAEYSKSEDEDA